MDAVQIRTKKETFTVDYPEALEFMDQQLSIFWPHFEVKVEKDKQDLLVNLSPAERHGVITTLKLFTKYEQIIGNEFWLNWVMKKFPRPADIQPMAALFGAVELSVHQFFYKELNEQLGIATDEFYNSYIDDETLSQRISYLEDTLTGGDELRAIGAFTFGEGAILYSSFAYLKHFQSQGKNKMINTVSGINFSARDENLHSEAAAWLFQTLKKELLDAGKIDDKYLEDLKEDIFKAAHTVIEHEEAIIKKLFEEGAVEGVTPTQLLAFCKSRVNLCLRNLGYDNLYKIDYNPIAEWFYKGITGYQFQDFFSSQGNQYGRGWDEQAFVWSDKQ